MLRYFGLIFGILIAVAVKYFKELPPLQPNNDITTLPIGVQEWYQKGTLLAYHPLFFLYYL